MATTQAGGSLYDMCAALWQVLRVVVPAALTLHWRMLLERTGPVMAALRALWVCAIPLITMLVGNVALFNGQAQEFVREFISSVDGSPPLAALLESKAWWLIGVSIWGLTIWYCARQLMMRLYLPGPGPAWLRLWQDLLRAYLPRLLAGAAILPVSLLIGALPESQSAGSTLLPPAVALLIGSAALFELALDGHLAPRWFNLALGGAGVVLVYSGIGHTAGGAFNPAAWLYIGSALMVAALIGVVVRVPWAHSTRGLFVGLATVFAGCALAAAGLWRLRQGASWLSYSALLSALMLLVLITWRRELVDAVRARFDQTSPRMLRPWVPVVHVNRGQLLVMGVSLISSFLLAALLNWQPVVVGRALGAPSIGLLAAMSLCLFFSLVLVLLPRSFGLPSLVLPALASAAIVGYLQPYRPIAGLGLRPGADMRPALADHLAQWKQRRSAADDDPIIVVAAEGGGVRAALWTALALARLNDATCGVFQHRVYAISGVSGGSLGAAFYVAQLAELGPGFAATRKGCWLQGSRLSQEAVKFFLNKDFLSPVLGAYLFGDLMRQFPGPNLLPGGRGRVLEDTWAQDWQQGLSGQRTGPNRFAAPFLDLYRGDALYELPLLFLNATTVEDGKRAIAAPVRSSHVDAFDLFHDQLATHGMTLATAVHNSARFPFVSPPGFIEQRSEPGGSALKPWGRVVDGGYFENSGAATAHEIVDQIAAAQGGKRDNIHVLILANAPRDADEQLCREILEAAPNTPPLCRTDTIKGDAPSRAWLPDITAPAQAMMATREARGSLAKAALAQAIGDPRRVHELYLAKSGHAYTDPPLGWYLSAQSFTGIDEALAPEEPGKVSEDQPARLALQRLAWQLVMTGPYDAKDNAATLQSKRGLHLCEKAGVKDCAGKRI